ncbi:hypothetical protein EV359DRAFT_68263 [Lentinula novae-zelandiae]|nr:hypothetical protein EV359DRAFT_68263 [Lentinula novae-zelandiae]
MPSEDSLPDPSNILKEVYTPRTASRHSSDKEVQFPDPEPIAQPVSIRWGCSCPKKAPIAASHGEIILVVPSFTFELLLHLIKPNQPVAGKLKKTKGKATKQEPEKKKHAKDEAYVIIQMKKPVQTIIPATVKSAIDKDESSNNDFLGPVAKKGKIDDELEGITQHLQLLYPAEKNNKPGVSWTQIPLSSALFHASQAIKKPTSPNTPSTSATALPALPATPIYPGGLSQYANGALWSISDASTNAAANGNAGGTWTSLAYAEQYFPPSVHVCSSPPAAPKGYALANFYAKYGLSDDIKAGLHQLEYEPGEHLTDVTAQEWHNAGIKLVQC